MGDELELFGVGPDELLRLTDSVSVDDDPTVRWMEDLQRTTSYQHSEFDNPRAESCWLSTTFQALWHSRVFHAVFESLIRPLPNLGRGTVLGALQEAWSLYEDAGISGHLVSTKPLVRAWGRGYGDCTEALGKLQHDPQLKTLDDLFAIIPVPWTGQCPTAAELSRLVNEMCGSSNSPLVALDFSFPPISNKAMQRLALAVGPMHADGENLGVFGSLELVALIAYMEDFAHYVVFCRSISDTSVWLFFNDLPGVGSKGSLYRLGSWDNVAFACGRYGACPKMLLYENPSFANKYIEEKQQKEVSATNDSPIDNQLNSDGTCATM